MLSGPPARAAKRRPFVPEAQLGKVPGRHRLGELSMSLRTAGLVLACALSLGITAPIQAHAGAQQSPGALAGDAADHGDYATALRLAQPLAERGDPEGENIMGLLYHFGWGVPKDPAKAVYWYSKAAEQGVQAAQNNLGGIYADGEGVPRNYELAVKWYRAAAATGALQAMTNLGQMYEDGHGVPKDDKTAIDFYRKAASAGYAPAEYDLGLMYESGHGVPRDWAQAAGWYRKAAEGFRHQAGLAGDMPDARGQ
ncbi:MAG: sel1 repeat family protein [Phenylobacterium sp.]|nr:MAG: sel1 repeat family protein [Phenylobacterium sp.]